MKPVLQSIVLCERIYVDQQSQNKVIAGTFNTFYGTVFPSKTPTQPWLFIALTDFVGELVLVVRFVDLSDNQILFTGEMKGPIVNDPLITIELVMQLPSIPLLHTGVFAMELLHEDTMLGALRLRVVNPNEEDEN